MYPLIEMFGESNVSMTRISTKEFGVVNLVVGANGTGKSTLLRAIDAQVNAQSDVSSYLIDSSEPDFVGMGDVWAAMSDDRNALSSAMLLIKSTHSLVEKVFSSNEDGGIRVKLTEVPTAVKLEEMGAGFIRLIEIIVASYAMNNGVILIDDIDAGISSNVFKPLWLYLAKNAKRKNNQIIAVVHSIECINSYSLVLKTLDDTKGFVVSLDSMPRNKKGMLTHITTYTEHQLKEAILWKHEVR